MPQRRTSPGRRPERGGAPARRTGRGAAPRSRQTSVVLFTRDLRVRDNPALWAACGASASIIPLFVVDPAIVGRPLASANRMAFLLESLADLRRSLRARGGDLFVRCGDTVVETLRVLDRSGASTVHLSDDVSAFARGRLERLRGACAGRRCAVVVHPGVSVVPAGELVPAGRDHYAVFTPYWRRWRAERWRAGVPVPRRVPVPHGLVCGRIPARPGRDAAVSTARPRGGETEGLARWSSWSAANLSHYGSGRDDLEGDSTSRISAYVHFGCLSPVELAHRAAAHEPFVRQLCWRDFHLQVHRAFPALGHRDYRERGRIWRHDPEAVHAWRTGHTGVPIVDAAMRQLRAEGFIGNRARMLAASYLVKELGVGWRIGASHFADWLVDADVAANSGNWQWIAGTGNDTRPGRTFNVVRQARRHDPDGAYVRRYLPELAGVPSRLVHEPWRLPAGERARLGYPQPLRGVPRGAR